MVSATPSRTPSSSLARPRSPVSVHPRRLSSPSRPTGCQSSQSSTLSCDSSTILRPGTTISKCFSYTQCAKQFSAPQPRAPAPVFNHPAEMGRQTCTFIRYPAGVTAFRRFPRACTTQMGMEEVICKQVDLADRAGAFATPSSHA